MTGRNYATALLVDLDGVLRHRDPAVVAEIERRHGLPVGAVEAAGNEWNRRKLAVTGELTHQEWTMLLVRELTGPAGDAQRAESAVAEWQRYRGKVDEAALDFVRQVRAEGIRVGLAANATGPLDAELTELGLIDEVDLVVSSWAVRSPKPAKEYFRQACQLLATPPGKVLFLDAEDRAVRGARVAGLSAYRWTGPRDLPYLRAALRPE
jgi:putative hydrolase of the HAD superfamily